MADRIDRRCFLARGVLGAAAVGAVHSSIEEKTLAAAIEDGTAQTAQADKPKTDIPPGSLPCGKIGNVSLSRLFIGGNLIGGWAHSRDLMYASKLFTSYNTEAKVFETLELAQACGINTIQLDPACWESVTKYNEQHSPKIQTMVCVPLIEDKTKMNDEIKRQVDLGATLLYSHGGVDRLAHDERRHDRRDRADGRPDQGPRRACRRRRPFAEHAHRLRAGQGRPRFLRQDVPHGPLLVGHARGAAEGI